MSYTVVTSFSIDGYFKYGRNFIKTFMKYWPSSVNLMIYHEGTGEVLDENHVRVNLLEDVKDCADFIDRYSKDDYACGRRQKEGFRWKSRAIQAGYNYRFDAVKFCRKVFAIEDAARRLDGGRLFWVDADVKTFSRVDIDLLDRTLPNNVALSYLGRPRSYSECGFVGYNLDHQDCKTFIHAFADMYRFGRVFDIMEWHDSYVFDYVRSALRTPGFSIPSSTDKGHVFINSELGTVMDHLKGDRKDIGRSLKREMVSDHTNEYWSKV